MKTTNIFLTFAILIAGLIAIGYVAPWWCSVLWVVVVIAYSKLKIIQGLFIGGLAMGLVWGSAAMFFGNGDTNQVLTKTANLLGGFSDIQFILITILLGMITGFLAGWVGSAAGQMIKSKVE